MVNCCASAAASMKVVSLRQLLIESVDLDQYRRGGSCSDTASFVRGRHSRLD